MIDRQKLLEDIIRYKYALEEERELDPQAYELKYKAMFDPEKENHRTMKKLVQVVQDFYLKPTYDWLQTL
jgi:hypothetical protein